MNLNLDFFQILILYTPITIIFLSFIIQFVFFGIYFFPFLFTKKKNTTDLKNDFAISVIVCAHNELENLKIAVPAILKQNYAHFELILIDDRSTDGTKEYFTELFLLEPRFNFVEIHDCPKHTNPKKFALTMGIKNAKTDYIVFTDADCVPVNENWLQQFSNHYQEDTQTQIVLGASIYAKSKGFLNLFIRFETLHTALMYLSFAFKNQAYMGVGRNISYRKSFFLQSKGFHPFQNIIGGDDDLFVNKNANKQNTKVEFSYESLTISKPKKTFKEWWHQKIRHISVGRYYNSTSKTKLAVFYSSMIISLFSFIYLFINPEYKYFIFSGYFIRLILIFIIYSKILKHFKLKFALYLLPVLEYAFIIYYLAIGLIGFRKKNITWK